MEALRQLAGAMVLGLLLGGVVGISLSVEPMMWVRVILGLVVAGLIVILSVGLPLFVASVFEALHTKIGRIKNG